MGTARHVAAITAVAAIGLSACAPEQGEVRSAEVSAPRQAPANTAPDAPTTPTPGRLGIGETAARSGPLAIATVDGLDLFLPAAGGLLVAFHEGSTTAASLRPALPTRAVMNGRAADVDVNTDVHASDLDAMVLPSRRRASDATSAVDVVVPPSVQVLAPVSGVIVAVETYALYGRHEDVRIVIAPDSRPDLQVTTLHVVDPLVGAGDVVTAGETAIATRARSLPVGSQVDRFTVRSWREEPPPHVHLEVRRVAPATED